ncbi:sugar diacid recognition domain-containing protein [Bacillus dakarensis]|uniref:sugar diacid recognition domain-containing protein n=1 Tax=Robertmurraya dakarensis TaxID=1926278 RepID=UPI000982300A|nr:sugar diacid recognition domain-containing protein [Bacillus dakarensis]
MIYLNKSLAQEIVNRTMKIINRNINVMNDKGIIIGSGDQSRIDSVHEGALRVIEKQCEYEINRDDSENLQGVKEGVNLPIKFRGNIIGVIGITGHPDEIRSFGELVKMAAEMILQQAELTEEIQWDERLKEELIIQLLNGKEELDSLYFDRIHRLKIDLTIPRVPIIFTTENRPKLYKAMKVKLDEQDLIVMMSGHVIILKTITLKDQKWDHGALLKKMDQWASFLKKDKGILCRISAGQYYPSVEGVSKAYRQAELTLEVGSRLDPDKKVYFYDDYKLPVFLAQAESLGLGEWIGPYYEQLQKHDKKGELIQTLLAYLEENGDINAITSKLYIHRNTLRYRLDKIVELTGKDPRRVKDLIYLYLSVTKGRIKSSS